METKSVTLVANPKTSPPDPNKAYIAVLDSDGNERWLLLGEDGTDTTDTDFDFDEGKRWAAEQKREP